MLSKIKSVAEFLSATRGAIGAGPSFDAIAQAQTTNLESMVVRTPIEVDEAAAVMRFLMTEETGSLFGEDGRTRLTSAIAASFQKPPDATVTGRSTKVQTHLHMVNYLTLDDWSFLQAEGTLASKIHRLSDRCAMVGLLYPSEMTVVAIVALVLVAAGAAPSPAESMTLVATLKVDVRRHRSTTPRLACDRYPEKVEDFMLTYPDVYRDALPIAPPIDPQEVNLRRSRMPARRTHRSMSQSSSSAGSSIASSTIGAGLAPMASSSDDLMRTLAQMVLGAMMGQPATNRPVDLVYPLPRALSQVGPLTLHDSLPDSASERGSPETPRSVSRQSSMAGLAQGGLDAGVRQSPSVSVSPASSSASGPQRPVVALDNDARRPPQLASILADMQVALGPPAASASKTMGPVGKSNAKAVAKSQPKKNAQSMAASEAAHSSKSQAKSKAASKTASSSDGLQGKVRIEWSRSQVVACANRKGPGSTKTFKFSGTACESAAKKARQWLSEQHD